MPESCPDPSRLAAWSEGEILDAPTADSIERHVANCPRCGNALEEQTRSRLAALDLGVLRSGNFGSEKAPSAVVCRLIQDALGGHPNGNADPLPNFLADLEPSSRQGSLGRFASYEIEALNGRGGMGLVFRGFDPTLQRQVAIKVLLNEDQLIGDEPAATRFLREARAIAALRHEHIVEVYAAGRQGRWPYLVMPFHARGTLQQWIDRGIPLRCDEAIRIGIQLLRALEVTHAQGILHRDLKPSNVLLERGLDHVRLADFGLAQSVATPPSAAGRVIAGTPSYMSPEQARGEALDARSDLFGLGAILHHLLTGHPPQAGTALQPAPAIATEAPPDTLAHRPTRVPRELEPVLARFLARQPADRFPNARAAREALENLHRGLGDANLSRRRFRAWAVPATALLVLSVALLAALEIAGKTSLLNSLLCHLTGDGFYVRGRFGTYSELTQAAAACRIGQVVVAGFNGERPVGPVRVEGNGLHLQAAPGLRPALLATNTSEPLFLGLGPLILEGLTLVSRTDVRDAGQLIAAEGTHITLTHCRLLRLRTSAEDVLVRSGRRLDPDQPLQIYKPLLTLRSGSSAVLRNSLFLGLGATGIGLKGNGPEPIEITMEQCLFTLHRCFALRPEPDTRVTLLARDSAFASAAMLDIENPTTLSQLTVNWDHCILDPTGGVLLRWTRGGDGSWLNRMTWKEMNVIYAGSGDFAFERRRGTVTSEADWNVMVRLPPGSHAISRRPLFGDVRVRFTQRLEAVDVDLAGLAADSGFSITFRPETVGEGSPLDRRRSQADQRGDEFPADATPETRIRKN